MPGKSYDDHANLTPEERPGPGESRDTTEINAQRDRSESKEEKKTKNHKELPSFSQSRKISRNLQETLDMTISKLSRKRKKNKT